jgi:hypothetical protein
LTGTNSTGEVLDRADRAAFDFGFANQVNAEDQEDRLNGVPVARKGVDEVIDGGVKKSEPEE